MEIGEKIRRIRIERGLTQEELADRAELSKGFISQIERDLTVIPEYFTEYQFRKDAAQILISATEKASHTEKEGIGTIFIFV